MKNLENVLKTCQKPEVEVPLYKEHLRYRIIQQYAAASSAVRFASLGFAFLTGAIFVFAGLLTLFILKPNVPGKVNTWLNNKPVINGLERKASLPLELTPVQQAFFSAENDQQYVQQWIHANYPNMNSRIFKIEEERIVTIRRIRLENGQKVMVMSEIDPKDTNQTTSQLEIGGIL
ncbi:MAG: hypothetical protein CR997_00435 [Acidobacteria bacterium]|nr:MAG: hypothetical protein CR997_00435 [Acidobacteriota bacterium]